MRVTYFVNAMMMFESSKTRVLCDPWITFDGESVSGLYNFPQTSMTRDGVASLKPDYIHITHTHADHFDAPTLALFPRETPVIVSWYDNNFTARSVAKLGFRNVIVSDPANGIPLNGGDHCWLEPSAVYPEVDSIGTFRLDGRVIVNANDNPFSAEQCASIKARYGPIDLACVPFSYQGPYPAFYENLSEAEKYQKAEERRQRHYDTVIKFAQGLDADYLFPFAGGAAYGGRKALLYPFYGVGTPQEAVRRVAQACRSKPVLLSEGCSFDLDTEAYQGTYVERGYETDRPYLERIAYRPQPFDQGGVFHIAQSERIDLSRLLQRARERQAAWQVKGRNSTATYFIDVGEEELYRLSLMDTKVSRVREAEIAENGFYEIFRVPYALLIGLLTGHYNWSNVKTQHVWFKRQPDQFDRDLHLLMSYLQL